MTEIARPGKVATHQYEIMYSRACAIIAPHSGIGGTAPNPTNDRLAVMMIACPASLAS